MRKPLPSRTAVLELLKSQDRALDARELADRLGVAPASQDGLLRMLDNLVFDGVVTARGDKFKLGATDKAPEKSERSERSERSAPHVRTESKPVHNGGGGGNKKSLKPLPKDLGRGGKRGGNDVRRSNDAQSSPDARAHAQEARRSRQDARQEERGMPKFQVAGGTTVTASPARVEHRDTGKRAPAKSGGRSDRERREGFLKVNPRGFGFVSSPTASGDDVYISPENLGGAMHGDHVVIDIVARGSRGPEGTIVEIKARGSQRVSGILRRRGKSAWVELDDPRMKGPVVLTSEIDKTSAEGEGNSGKDGQVVVVQITRFPETNDENPEGKLLAVLGAPGELSVETRKVILIHGIDEVHSPAAIAEAEAYGPTVPEDMLVGREDLTHIPLPTIDPEDARDHDDAVWVERTKNGGYELWVAIADVSSYVLPGTHIDEESRKRGCSIYLPDRAIPMLPRALSSNLCSLLPDVVRLCLCVHAVLDAKGNVEKTRLVRGYMKSAAKLTYGGVARALGFTEIPKRDPKADAMVEGLKVAAECSRLLRSKRMKRGALDFDLPEAVVKLDDEGKPISVSKRSGDPGMKKAYQLIEELMIFANEVVARWLLEHELPGVYRVHLPPDPKKLDKLAAMCEMLGVEFDVENTQTPKGLADLLKKFATHPLSNVLNNLLLRSMKQATYDVQNLGHFGLASEAYLHFTSPIRRYPDLVVHRIVHAAVDPEHRRGHRKGIGAVGDIEKLTEAATQSSLAERRAMEVEREIVDIYRCFYMIDHIGERFEGTVSAFVGTGAFVTLDEPFVDVLVRVEDMGADYQIEDDGLMATSSRSGDAIRLGDRMLVDITDCAILRRTVYAKRVRSEADAADDALARRQSADRGGPGGPRRGAGGPGAAFGSKGGKDRGRSGGGDRDRNARGGGGERGRGPAQASAGPAPKGKKSGGGGRKAGKKGKRR
ncbi:MAG: 3-to-5 exoribonuclease RNase [Labilithrix sp.]|nr:3-to-5 exoribonuclease RNase [Labilithrix sp.]